MRSRVTRVPFTPKLKSKGAKVDTVNLTELPVDYELVRSKVIKNKIEAASRPHSVILTMARGNIVITFSAAAYEEFKSVTLNYLHSKGLTLNTTETTEKRGAVVSESTAVFEGNKKLYILDRNDSFSVINKQIREYCEQFLSKSGKSADNCQEIETASTEKKKLSSLNVNKASSLPAIDNTACASELLIGPQFPLCLVCNRQCDENPTSVACDICNQWIHFKCEGLTPEKVSEIELNDELYICRLCTNQRVIINSDMETNINHDNSVVNSSVRQTNLNSNTESVGQTPLTRTFDLRELSANWRSLSAESTAEQFSTETWLYEHDENYTMSKPSILPTKTAGLQPATSKSPKPQLYPTKHQISSGEGETYSADPKSADSPIDNPILTESTPSPVLSSLNLLTFNIEGFNSNKLYLETLSKRSDILFLQEHWLHSYEKHKLDEFLQDFICYTKCFDDNLLSEAICIHKKFEKFVELLPDGGNRIIGIKFNTTQPFIFLSTYLPCRGNANSIDNYQEILDELSEIYIKYSNVFRIVIGGDMNASISRDSKQDKVFRDFIKENNLLIPPSCGKTFTFYHYNGRDTFQIDYFLERKSVISNYLTFIRESTNTSTHDPILTTIPCNIQANEETNLLTEKEKNKLE
ncbi:unnamed protein product [Mytilus coruscus]|uniref:PHD-type domain-containing protein n=1 Tax=Mytilus coruscus TaxID=42192 RepID=A0A6J8ENX1_MYTCO|nr:unnamed protein product [Mytilus coruscus]